MFVESLELEKIYFERFGKRFPKSTLSKWKKENRIAWKEHPTIKRRFLYNLDDFNKIINSQNYEKKIKATKEKPENYIGKINGSLLIKGIVPDKEKSSDYTGTLMYCQCLRCNRPDLIQVRFAYLTPNGNYHQYTCGCNRKERAFLASSREGITENFVEQFEDFDYYLLVHKILVSTTDRYYIDCDIKIYEKAISYLYNDKQLKMIYDFWTTQDKSKTYYDWAKPSLDHKIPKSRGGTNDIENLQILTVFENLSKRDMTQEEWEDFKKTTNTTSDYFLENIIRMYEGGNC